MAANLLILPPAPQLPSPRRQQPAAAAGAGGRRRKPPFGQPAGPRGPGDPASSCVVCARQGDGCAGCQPGSRWPAGHAGMDGEVTLIALPLATFVLGTMHRRRRPTCVSTAPGQGAVCLHIAPESVRRSSHLSNRGMRQVPACPCLFPPSHSGTSARQQGYKKASRWEAPSPSSALSSSRARSPWADTALPFSSGYDDVWRRHGPASIRFLQRRLVPGGDIPCREPRDGGVRWRQPAVAAAAAAAGAAVVAAGAARLATAAAAANWGPGRAPTADGLPRCWPAAAADGPAAASGGP